MDLHIELWHIAAFIGLVAYILIARWFVRLFVYEGNMTPGRATLEAVFWPWWFIRGYGSLLIEWWGQRGKKS